MNEEQLKHQELLREAFNEYLRYFNELPVDLVGMPLDYEFSFIERRVWSNFGDKIVRGDLQELTNLINRWGNLLYRWHAWGKVVDSREEMERWELNYEFLDSMVHECLLMPAAIRDTITSVATAAFHQVRLSTESSYPDYLEGEPKTPEERPKQLNRGQKEKRLSRLLEIWPESTHFLSALREINTPDYVNETLNYRNLWTHAIGPRLGIGETRLVTRCLEQAQIFKELDDGSLVIEDVPGKLSVSYGFGGTPPLNLNKVRVANLEQYKKARLCYINFRQLLEAVVAGIESV